MGEMSVAICNACRDEDKEFSVPWPAEPRKNASLMAAHMDDEHGRRAGVSIIQKPKPPMTASERAMRSRIGAHKSWANTEDRAARLLPARLAFNAKFEREVDPDGTLPPDERARRAESARKEYFTRLAYKSARKRRRE